MRGGVESRKHPGQRSKGKGPVDMTRQELMRQALKISPEDEQRIATMTIQALLELLSEKKDPVDVSTIPTVDIKRFDKRRTGHKEDMGRPPHRRNANSGHRY